MSDTSSIKQQAIDESAALAAEKPPHLHALARAKSAEPLARAVSHLNAQTERGGHMPWLDYAPSE